MARVNNESDLLAANVTHERWSDPQEQMLVFMTLTARPISFEVGGERITAGYLWSKVIVVVGLVAFETFKELVGTAVERDTR